MGPIFLPRLKMVQSCEEVPLWSDEMCCVVEIANKGFQFFSTNFFLGQGFPDNLYPGNLFFIWVRIPSVGGYKCPIIHMYCYLIGNRYLIICGSREGHVF